MQIDGWNPKDIGYDTGYNHTYGGRTELTCSRQIYSHCTDGQPFTNHIVYTICVNRKLLNK